MSPVRLAMLANMVDVLHNNKKKLKWQTYAIGYSAGIVAKCVYSGSIQYQNALEMGKFIQKLGGTKYGAR